MDNGPGTPRWDPDWTPDWAALTGGWPDCEPGEAAPGEAAPGEAGPGGRDAPGAAPARSWPGEAAGADRGPELDAAGPERPVRTAPAPDLRMSLEAVLLVADEPVTGEQLAAVTEHPAALVAAALRELSAAYTADQRGFDLREVAGGWRLYTRAECAAVVERFVSDGQEIRLTQAALETLAVVAYRQPVSRARVSAVRGVSCDGVMRTLVLRGLIEEAGSDPESGAILFQTTGYFLERLGLASLADLPDLVPFLPDHLDDELDAGHAAG